MVNHNHLLKDSQVDQETELLTSVMDITVALKGYKNENKAH